MKSGLCHVADFGAIPVILRGQKLGCAEAAGQPENPPGEDQNAQQVADGGVGAFVRKVRRWKQNRPDVETGK